MSESAPVVVETGSDPVGSVIWLHGLGADGHDFEAIVPELRLPADLSLRFVFPHAPVRPVTINNGMQMRAWYDIRSFDAEGRADEEGIRASSAILDDLVAAEQARGISKDRIVVAGFSQGGVIGLHYALRSTSRLAGLMALSTYMPLPRTIATEVAGNPACQDRSLPVFVAHGSLDTMVPFAAGLEAAATLRELGYTVTWHEYPMGHGVCPQEIADIRDWLLHLYTK
jgi:phospholipase/carboxylesterase